MDAARRKQYAKHSVKPEKRQHSVRHSVRLTFQLDSLKPEGLRGAAASSLIKNLCYLPRHSHWSPHLLAVFISSLSVAVQAQTHHIESPPFLPPPALWGLWLIAFDGVCAWKKKKETTSLLVHKSLRFWETGDPRTVNLTITDQSHRGHTNSVSPCWLSILFCQLWIKLLGSFYALHVGTLWWQWWLNNLAWFDVVEKLKSHSFDTFPIACCGLTWLYYMTFKTHIFQLVWCFILFQKSFQCYNRVIKKFSLTLLYICVGAAHDVPVIQWWMITGAAAVWIFKGLSSR